MMGLPMRRRMVRGARRKPTPVAAREVRGPYRTESAQRFGQWHADMGDAMDEAKTVSGPCRVVSRNGVVLAFFSDYYGERKKQSSS